MDAFQLIYVEDSQEIVEGLNKLVNCFKLRNIEIGISESMVDKTHFVNVYFSREHMNDKLMNIFYIYISNILYKVFINKCLEIYIFDFINDTYFFLEEEEIKEIKNKCIKILKEDSILMDGSNIHYLNEKNEMIDKILMCVKENDKLNIDGFLTFRTKQLKEKINFILEKIVEEHMVEKEYNEFIKLIKYFVNIQESKIDEVNIIILENGKYIILDRHNNNITNKLFSEFTGNEFSIEINTDDILISGLITYCPEKIIIHHVENCINKEIINTIKNVFPKRVFFCNQCEMCNKKVKKKGK